MKKLLGALVVCATLIAGFVLATPEEVWANSPAIVFNSGRDGGVCALVGVAGFNGLGRVTLLFTSSGNFRAQCAGTVNEAPPSRAIHFSPAMGPFGSTCRVIITPGGRFSGICQ